jgi:hypothetical protein
MVTNEKLDDNDRVDRSAREVLSRMSGCADPNCMACVNNLNSIRELIKVVREERPI